MDVKQRLAVGDNDNFFFGAGCLYAAILLERPIWGEIWKGGDSWAGLDYC